jgi:asparagine synthase (glutamine-hydrolysing)
MCGIYVTNLPLSREEVSTKINRIKYRGPDFTGTKCIDNLSFGHLRLSIIDLDNRSNQPMDFEEFTIVFNGEIYNFNSIKSELIDLGYSFETEGDTEVLLKGYKEWGDQVVKKLNGMFSFVIYNQITKKLFCSRDRLGVKPFYFSWEDGKFEICSQLKPISDNKIINEDAISMFLEFSYIPSPYSIFKDVYKLPPGNNLSIDLNSSTYTISEYWNLNNVEVLDCSYESAKNQLHDLLTDAVKIRMQADVPFGAFLSGGIDSALISSIASKVSTKPIKTFSIGFNDPKFDESKIAKEYSKIIGSIHTEKICTPEDVLNLIPKLFEVYDEPFADSSALPSLLLNKFTRQQVVVALSGDGGDESFLGYNHFDLISKFKIILKIPYKIRHFFSYILRLNLFGRRSESIRRILNYKNSNDFIKGIFLGFGSILKKPYDGWFSSYSNFSTWSDNLYQQTADLNIKLWLENDSNVKVDRASMAYSVEIRSPFLDYRIIEFARKLPISYRYIKNRKKRILRDILKLYIPEQIFNHPKKGFSIPLGKWIREELHDEFLINLSDDFLNKVHNLNVIHFKEMLKLHLEGSHDFSSYIWRVYVLSKWLQEYGFIKRNNA